MVAIRNGGFSPEQRIVARAHFKVGDQVILSDEGAKHFNPKRLPLGSRAQVVGFSPRNPHMLAVVRAGLKTRELYQAAFWRVLNEGDRS